MKALKDSDSEKELYVRQNRAIHKARGQLCIELDDCRELAREINGKASISSLTLRQRWELIEILKSKGARVKNPYLPASLFFPGSNHRSRSRSLPPDGAVDELLPQSDCSLEGQERPEDVYPNRLAYWNSRFPRKRPGYATNKELAWIESLFTLDFNDGRAGTIKRGLRGFIYRQTAGLKDGPVSDLIFLKSHHVQAVLSPLKEKAREKQEAKG